MPPLESPLLASRREPAPFAPPPSPPDPGPQLRDIGDVKATRTRIYEDVLHAASSLPEISNQRHTLRLSGLKYVDPEDYSIRDQKQAILANKTLSRRLRGTWSLVDNTTGQEIDRRQATIAHVPYLSPRGTIINNGTEYVLQGQLRMRPGVFTRIKANGELESHANILPGDGVSHRYFLDPEKGVFKIHVGQANIPLMPLLRAMGATDKQLREAWGNELFLANAVKDDTAALNKIYERLVRRGDPGADRLTKQQAIAQAFDSMRMDPEVNQRTLGQAHDRMSLDTMLAITRKLLNVSQGKAEVDDRDHLAFQTFLGPEDLITERLTRDYGGTRRELLRRASQTSSLRSIPVGALTKQIQSVLYKSGLAQALEEINLAEVYDKQSKVSRLGEGGISSLDAVPDEARSVQPSHLNYIDPVRTPESAKVGVDSYLATRVKKGRDGRLYSPFLDTRSGQLTYKSAQDVADLTVAFPGQDMTRPRVGVMRNGRIDFAKPSEVDLVVPHFEQAFSPLGAMVPMKSATKAQRMAMASRMFTQALPLVGAESPLVQSGVPDQPDKSFEELFGDKMGAVRAKQGGKVLAVSPDEIKVQYDDGKTDTIELYRDFPFNFKTYYYNTPAVRPGDTFQPDQLLARSNYTDERGVPALGKNLRVGYIPYRGWNFEDAVVISESAAKKLSSEHAYQHGLTRTDDYKTSKNDFVSLFGAKFPRKLLDTLDDDGVVKEGTTVNYGDPLILAAKQNELAHNKVHRKKQPTYSNATVTWKHHEPGVVTDAIRAGDQITVMVKSTAASQVGDKLAGRYGDKGVISAIVPDNEMPQDESGQPLEILVNPLGLISRTNSAQIMEAVLGKIAAKTGKPYKVRDFEEIQDLAEWARNEASKHHVKDTETVTDPDTGKGIRNVLVGNRFYMKLHHTAASKEGGRGTGGYTAEGTPAKGGESGCFVGSQRVMTIDGPLRISHICEKQLRTQVLTYSRELQDWVYRPVTDWFVYRAKVEDIIEITTAGPCLSAGGTQTTPCTLHKISTTKNHEFFLFDGTKIEAGNLQVGDMLATRGVGPTEHQIVPMRIDKIEPYRHDKPVTEINVYDFTVDETHAYCAGPALVSNSKRVSLLDSNALLSLGATQVIRDAGAVRGQRNEDFWLAFLQGVTPPKPRVPPVYEKFVDQLRASGINVLEDGTKTHIMALTDKDIDALAGDRYIQSGETVRFEKGMEPVAGGLFDEKLTGGHNSSRWSAIKLHEPFPSPVMEEPIRRVLGLTQNKFLDVLAGKEKLAEFGTGPAAIGKALDKINVGRAIEVARMQLQSGRKTQRDEAIRKLGYLKAAEKLGIHPRDWMLSKVPVLPTRFRAVATMSDKKLPLVPDANFLYKELIDANKNLQEMQGLVGEDIGEERLATYNAFKAVVGLGDPVHPKLQEKNVKGVLKQIFGCYDETTEVLTEHGWKKFAELSQDVRVATIELESGEFQWQMPTEYQKYYYAGDMIRLVVGDRSQAANSHRRVDLLITPGHRQVVKERLKGQTEMTEGWTIEEAWRVAASTGRQYFMTAARTWKGHRKKPVWVKGCLRDFAEFVGWWLAEGWLGERKPDGEPRNVQLCQELARNRKKCERIQGVLERLGFRFVRGEYSTVKKETGRLTRFALWTITEPKLVAWLWQHVGSLAHRKRLSHHIRNWDKEILAALLQGYLLGDGNRRNVPAVCGSNKITHEYRSELTDTHNQFTTTSRQLVDDLTEIGVKLGITLRPGEVSREIPENHHQQYRTGIVGRWFTQTEGDIGKSVEHYEGYVYCCTVPNGTLVVRRNGVVSVSGNSSPKLGTLQRRLLSSTVDVVGRAVITPDPDLDMDQIGLPEDKAWEIYRNFVARQLRRRGVPLVQALQHIENRSSLAKEELLKAMDSRPVIANRAPVLHKFGMLAFYPRLTKGHTLRISPLVVNGFNADFDGDSCIGATICIAMVPYALLRSSLVSWNDLSGSKEETMLPDKESIQLWRKDRTSALVRLPIRKFPRGKLIGTTPKGVKRYAVPEGVCVLSYDAKTGRSDFFPVTEFSVHPDLSGFQVQVGRNHTVGVSEDHSLYCYDPVEGCLEKTKPQDAIGKLCPIVKKIDDRPDLSWTKQTTEKLGMAVPARGNVDSHHLPVDEVWMDFKFGWWLGTCVADAWTDLPTRAIVHYCKVVPELQQRFREIVACLLRTDGNAVSEPRTTQHTLQNNAIAGKSSYINLYASCLAKFVHRWLEGKPKGALSKRLPRFFLWLPYECKLGIFCGLLDGDGTVDLQQAAGKKTKTFNCKYTTSSVKLKNDILLLTKFLGIKASVTEDRRAETGETVAKHISYVICFSKPDIVRLRHKLRLANPDKQAVLDLLENECDDPVNLVPVSKPLFQILRQLVGSKHKGPYTRLSEGLRKGFMTRDQASQLLVEINQLAASRLDTEEVKKRWLQWTRLVLDESVYWAPVTEIAPLKRQTMYDLTVSETAVFAVNNGLIIYDTMQYHVPVDDDAAKEAAELMLPSRNLFSPADFKSVVHRPTQEYTGGLYTATSGSSGRPPRVFANMQSVIAAYRRGEIDADDPVEILSSRPGGNSSS